MGVSRGEFKKEDESMSEMNKEKDKWLYFGEREIFSVHPTRVNIYPQNEGTNSSISSSSSL